MKTNVELPSPKILVLEQSGKWTAALRRRTFSLSCGSSVVVKRCLSLDDLFFEQSGWLAAFSPDLLPAPAALIVDVPVAKLPATLARFQSARGAGQRAIWFVLGAEMLHLMSLIQQLGMAGTITSLTDLDSLANGIQRFFANCTPVDWPLELRIEQQYPWPRVRLAAQ